MCCELVKTGPVEPLKLVKPKKLKIYIRRAKIVGFTCHDGLVNTSLYSLSSLLTLNTLSRSAGIWDKTMQLRANALFEHDKNVMWSANLMHFIITSTPLGLEPIFCVGYFVLTITPFFDD